MQDYKQQNGSMHVFKLQDSASLVCMLLPFILSWII